MGYSSAFDDLLAQGRQELDRMTGRTGAEAPAAPAASAPQATAPARGDGARTIEGTARGIPFRLKVGPAR